MRRLDRQHLPQRRHRDAVAVATAATVVVVVVVVAAAAVAVAFLRCRLVRRGAAAPALGDAQRGHAPQRRQTARL